MWRPMSQRCLADFLLGINNNDPAFAQSVYRAVAVISLVRNHIFARKSNGSSSCCALQMSLRFLGVSRTHSGFPSPSTTAWTFVLNPPRLRPSTSSPLFCAAAMLVNLDCGAVQRQSVPTHNLLGNQRLKTCSQAPCRLHRRKRVYTLFSRAIPHLQVPPRYPCFLPVQNSIEHCPIVSSGPSARSRLFWQQQAFHLTPLFFCQFMSLHALALLLVLLFVYPLFEYTL